MSTALQVVVRMPKNNTGTTHQLAKLNGMTLFSDGALDFLGLSNTPSSQIASEDGDQMVLTVQWSYPQARFQAQFPSADVQKQAIAGQVSSSVAMQVPTTIDSEVVSIV